MEEQVAEALPMDVNADAGVESSIVTVEVPVDAVAGEAIGETRNQLDLSSQGSSANTQVVEGSADEKGDQSHSDDEEVKKDLEEQAVEPQQDVDDITDADVESPVVIVEAPVDKEADEAINEARNQLDPSSGGTSANSEVSQESTDDASNQSHSDDEEVKEDMKEQVVEPQQDVDNNTDADVESPVVIVEVPVANAAGEATDEARNKLDSSSQGASANTEVPEESAADVVKKTKEEETKQDCGAGCSSLLRNDGNSARPSFRQNQLPRHVNYADKDKISTTIIGQPDDDSLKLKMPRSAVYSAQDNVFYVADHGNDRVMVYDVDGRNGREFYKVQGPIDLAVADTEVIVLCPREIHIVTRNGICTKTLTSYQHYSLVDCTSVLYHQGHIIVLDNGSMTTPVIFYDRDGVQMRHFSTLTHLADPRGLAVDKGLIYIADHEKNCVEVFSWNGRHVEDFGKANGKYGATGICVDGQGYVSVARYLSCRVDVYGPDRKFECSYGRPGDDSGCLFGPASLRMMPDGRAIVCEYANNRVQLI